MEFVNFSKIAKAEEAAKLAQKERERESLKMQKQIEKYLEEI